MKNFFNSFTQLLFPNLCICCKGYLSNQERFICDMCNYNLPLYEFNSLKDNDLRKKFWGTLPIQECLAYLSFKQNNEVQKVMHELKYNGNKEICFAMGLTLGRLILSFDKLDDIDFIIPIPLHKKREDQRGFNQAEVIANGVSNIIKAPVLNNVVVRVINNKSQTNRNRLDRSINTDNIFKVMDLKPLEGKHILLLDDVITTGATMISCGNSLLRVKDLKLSVAGLAVAN
jgi:ComF family protein